jgi:DNA-binding transcriptional LysR family regulator
MALPVHLLRHFVAVADCGGFSRAAAAMHVSQPAVSKAVQELEAQTGTTLVERGPGPLRLTGAGKLLAGRARELFAVERAAEEELRLLRGLERGALTVGASTTVADYHLPPLLARFHAAHPAVSLRLVNGNTHEVAELLVALDVDVAIVEGPVDDPRLESIVWRHEDMDLVAGAGHRLAARDMVGAGDLRDEVFVMREPGSGTRDVAEAALASLGVRATRIVEAGSTQAIKHMVAAGLGLTIAPLVATADLIALGRLRVLPVPRTPAFRRVLWRLRMRSRQPGAAAREFEAMLDE